ncbi:MAG: endonuclease III domain-containing protein [Syntrophotaleaceae bacterium]
MTNDSLIEIFNRLADHFGPLHWWPAETPFEVAVGAILTQNTNWRNVEMAVAALKKAGILSVAGLLEVERQRLEELIRSAGFFRQKAERLQLFAAYLQRNYGGDLTALLEGPLAEVRRELLTLKGVGPETADSILLYAGERPSFVVDAYTRRLFNRLGLLTGEEKYEDIRALFMDCLPHSCELFNEFHALIVEECKNYCRVQPICAACPLQSICEYDSKL